MGSCDSAAFITSFSVSFSGGTRKLHKATKSNKSTVVVNFIWLWISMQFIEIHANMSDSRKRMNNNGSHFRSHAILFNPARCLSFSTFVADLFGIFVGL